MNSSNFSFAKRSQSVDAQSATKVFSKQPSIFVTLLSSVIESLALIKNVLQCVSKSRTTLGVISPSIRMGARDKLGWWIVAGLGSIMLCVLRWGIGRYSSDESDVIRERDGLRPSVGTKAGVTNDSETGVTDDPETGAGDDGDRGSRDGGRCKILLDCRFASVQEP